MKLIIFCETCGTKSEPHEKFCTNCGVSLERLLKSDSSQLISDVIKKDSDQQVKVSSANPKEDLVTPKSIVQSPLQNLQVPDVRAGASKFSFLKIGFISVAILAIIAVSSIFIFNNNHNKEVLKNSNGSVSQKQITLAKSQPALNITGQMLIDAAVKGNVDEFDTLLQQLKSRILPASLDRKQARALNSEALKAISIQDYSLAIELLKKALDADLADAEISNNLGYAFRMSGDFNSSEIQLLNTLEHFPTRQQAWFDIGETYSKMGKHTQAVASFITAHRLAKNPDKLLEKYEKLLESTEDEALKNDLVEVTNLIKELK